MRFLKPCLIASALLGAATVSFLATLSATSVAQPVAPTTAASGAPLLDWLKVPAAQQAKLREHDPSFAADLAQLRSRLEQTRRELATALDDVKSSDEKIREKCEAVLAARVAVERRTTDYLLNIRPYLTPAQQKQLFGLAAEQVRQPGAGNRWRHGRNNAGR